MDSSGRPSESRRALVALDDRLHRMAGLFRRLTGHTAVVRISASGCDPEHATDWIPPIHPACAARVAATGSAPCSEHLESHLRTARRSLGAHSHVCPLGLRCGCVPVRFGDDLVGLAKLVVGPHIPRPRFDEALRVLHVLVSEACRECAERYSLDPVRRTETTEPANPERNEAGAALVAAALAHLQLHYRDRSLNLGSIAETLSCSPRYLTTCFTRIVGRHMRRHVVALRVSHACRLLTTTELCIKEVAFESGFTNSGAMARAFRSRVGVSPSAYRRMFAPSTGDPSESYFLRIDRTF